MKTPTFSLSEANPPVFGITEIVIEFGQPVVDPFRSVSVSAVVGDPAGNSLSLEGFCDAQDDRVYRVRVMPKIVGEHSVRVQVG